MQESINDLKKSIKDNISEVDSKLTQFKINLYSQLRNSFFLISVLLSTIGIIIYYQRNKNLFKKDFNTFNFLVGVNDKICFGNNK